MPSLERGHVEEIAAIEHNSRRHEEQGNAAKASQDARGIADGASNSSRAALEQSAENLRVQKQKLADAKKVFEEYKINEKERKHDHRIIDNDIETPIELVKRYKDDDKGRQEEDNRRQEHDNKRQEDNRRQENEKRHQEDERRSQEREKRRQEQEMANAARRRKRARAAVNVLIAADLAKDMVPKKLSTGDRER